MSYQHPEPTPDAGPPPGKNTAAARGPRLPKTVASGHAASPSSGGPSASPMRGSPQRYCAWGLMLGYLPGAAIMIALLIYTAGSSPRDLETYVYPGVAEGAFFNLYFAFGGGALGLVAWGGARLVAARSASPLRRALASLYAVATVEILVLLPIILTTSLPEMLLDVRLIIPLTLSLLGTVGVVLWHERT